MRKNFQVRIQYRICIGKQFGMLFQLKCTIGKIKDLQEEQYMSTIERNYYNMMDLPYMHNFTHISGTVYEVPYGYEFLGERFYTMSVEVERLSGTSDYIPVTLPGRLLYEMPTVGSKLTVEGQVRTYDIFGDDGQRHLDVRIFAQKVWNCSMTVENFVALTGTICRPTVYRNTPFGREICDVMLAVNRKFGKSDYIPCITWGMTARQAARLQVGSCVKIKGRFQSRDYEKDGIIRQAHEISVIRMEAE